MRLHRSEPAVTERTLTADDFTNALLEGVIKDIQWVENKYSNIASLAFIKDGLANLRREAASRLIPKPPQKRSGIHLVNGVIPLEIMLQAMRLYWEAGQRDKATAVASSYAGARKTFDAQCALEGKVREQLDNIAERVHNKQLQPPLALTEAKKIVDGCIALAGTTGVPGVRLSEFYGQANDFVLARSLDRNRFDLATEELFKTSAANKALAVAVAQDMLILIYKFLADFYKYRWRPRSKIAIGAPMDLSDSKAEPNEIRARKALLRLAKPGRDEASEIKDADVDALPAEVAMNLKGLLNGLARRQAVWLVRMGVQGIENSVLFAVESELQEQFGSAPPKLAMPLPLRPGRNIIGRARPGLAKPLSHNDSLPLLTIDALEFSPKAPGDFATAAVGVLSALLAIGRRALSWISARPPSSLSP